MKITAHLLRVFPVFILWLLVTILALRGKPFPNLISWHRKCFRDGCSPQAEKVGFQVRAESEWRWSPSD